MIARLRKQVPYFIVLLVAAFLYYRATQIGFAAPGDRIGPDVWPKAILALAMVTCIYEIAKNLFFTQGREVGGVLESVIEDTPEGHAAQPEEAPAPITWRLVAGAGMTVAYAALIDKVGFFVCTAVFLACFIWVGGYRRVALIAVLSLGGSLAFMFMFMKVVYVSLPLGIGPFAHVSVLLMRLLGIR